MWLGDDAYYRECFQSSHLPPPLLLPLPLPWSQCPGPGVGPAEHQRPDLIQHTPPLMHSDSSRHLRLSAWASCLSCLLLQISRKQAFVSFILASALYFKETMGRNNKLQWEQEAEGEMSLGDLSQSCELGTRQHYIKIKIPRTAAINPQQPPRSHFATVLWKPGKKSSTRNLMAWLPCTTIEYYPKNK